MKNKKGAQTQKQIAHIKKNLIGNQEKDKKKAEPSKKEEKKKKEEELRAIFKPVTQTQKIEEGVNPKSVLCSFYKSGICGKGDKCKFSHDLSLGRKAATRNYYEADENKGDVPPEDKMEDWDEDKLKDVIEKKHGAGEKTKPKTAIICKHFLEALENNKYGWFWECPTGGEKCHYRHALPLGFVLKKDLKKEKKEEISIEDLVERERAKLGYDLPRITLSSFLNWKRQKIEEKKLMDEQDLERKKKEFNAGRHIGLSGRDMFTFNPDIGKDDEWMEDGEGGFDLIREDLEDDEDTSGGNVVELDLERLAKDAREADGTGTVAAPDSRQFDVSPQVSATLSDPIEAAGPINEDLFDDLDDEDDDLQDLEEQLQDFDINNKS